MILDTISESPELPDQMSGDTENMIIVSLYLIISVGTVRMYSFKSCVKSRKGLFCLRLKKKDQMILKLNRITGFNDV